VTAGGPHARPRPAPWEAVAALGRVASYDAARGLGEVEGSDGARHPFHATAIADGSRQIEVGAPVAFTLRTGHGGRHEVRSLTPVVDPPA
jgi:cold shock CspA family protein